MKGFGFALERRWQTMTEGQRSLMLSGIVHDADRMDTILRELVDAARVVAGTFEPLREDVDVAAVVSEVVEQKRRDPEHPPVDWAGASVAAFVDRARLKTTLLAFVESLAWWAHEGPVHVDARLDDGSLHVWAERSGSDLDPSGAEALFAPRRPGAGAGSKIGLFVAREVARAQGGRAWSDVDGSGRLALHVELPAR
jgi:signal transduction histidine kinase